MRPSSTACWSAALLGLVLTAPCAWSQTVVPTGFTDQQMVTGLDFPVGMAFLRDGRLLVLEQKAARVNLVILGVPTTLAPILTVPEVNTAGGEQGLLGIAIDPGWPARAYIYVHYNHAGDSKIRISRFTVTGDLSFAGNGSLAVDPASRYDVLVDVPDLVAVHNGGTLRFGPDGMLYDSIGEDANMCAAQDTVSMRGVILRLDVSRLPATSGGPAPKALITPPGNPFPAHPDSSAHLVWALGLRNPFRFHIDMPTGDLYIADVGEGRWEEVDIAREGGLNFGWPHYEGPQAVNRNCADNNSDFVAPIYAFDRSGFTAAIVSGGLYRRPGTGVDRFPSFYDGNYFFNDYYQGFMRRLVGSGNAWTIAPVAPGQPDAQNWGTGFRNVSDWAVGPTGALWYCKEADAGYASFSGEIRRLVYAPGTAPLIAAVESAAGTDGRSATIRWQTDIDADSRVDYGVLPGTLDQSVVQTPSVLDHVVLLGGLEPETIYFYRVSSSTAGGTTVFPDPQDPPLDFLTFPLPGTVQLLPPFPSPAIGGATLPFDLAAPAVVTLRLYDLRGRRVRTLIGGEMRDMGANAEPWDGRDDDGHDAPAGVYIVRLGVGGQHLERRFAMIR